MFMFMFQEIALHPEGRGVTCACGEPHIVGGIRTPCQSGDALPAMYVQLLGVGVPAAIARSAAQLVPTDLDAALDWACSSDRRRTRPTPSLAAEVIEVEDSAFCSRCSFSQYA